MLQHTSQKLHMCRLEGEGMCKISNSAVESSKLQPKSECKGKQGIFLSEC